MNEEKITNLYQFSCSLILIRTSRKNILESLLDYDLNSCLSGPDPDILLRVRAHRHILCLSDGRWSHFKHIRSTVICVHWSQTVWRAYGWPFYVLANYMKKKYCLIHYKISLSIRNHKKNAAKIPIIFNITTKIINFPFCCRLNKKRKTNYIEKVL